jgi:hypothetical protein
LSAPGKDEIEEPMGRDKLKNRHFLIIFDTFGAMKKTDGS